MVVGISWVSLNAVLWDYVAWVAIGVPVGDCFLLASSLTTFGSAKGPHTLSSLRLPKKPLQPFRML